MFKTSQLLSPICFSLIWSHPPAPCRASNMMIKDLICLLCSNKSEKRFKRQMAFLMWRRRSNLFILVKCFAYVCISLGRYLTNLWKLTKQVNKVLAFKATTILPYWKLYLYGKVNEVLNSKEFMFEILNALTKAKYLKTF